MTALDLRAALASMGLSQSEFARALQTLGDTRPWLTILRNVQELARADRAAPIPWAVAALIAMMERAPDAWRR